MNKLISCIMFFLLICIPLNVHATVDTENITRAEIAVAVSDTYEEISKLKIYPIIERRPFADVSCYTCPQHVTGIVNAYCYGFVDQVAPDYFMPHGNVTRAEAAEIMFRLVVKLGENLTISHSNILIKDINNIPYQVNDECQYMISAGFMTLDDGYFYPDLYMSISECNEIITRIKHSSANQLEVSND